MFVRYKRNVVMRTIHGAGGRGLPPLPFAGGQGREKRLAPRGRQGTAAPTVCGAEEMGQSGRKKGSTQGTSFVI